MVSHHQIIDILFIYQFDCQYFVLANGGHFESGTEKRKERKVAVSKRQKNRHRGEANEGDENKEEKRTRLVEKQTKVSWGEACRK